MRARVQNPVGNTGLHWAAWHGRLGMLKVMLDGHADPNVVNNGGNTALHLVSARTACLPACRAACRPTCLAGPHDMASHGLAYQPAACWPARAVAARLRG